MVKKVKLSGEQEVAEFLQNTQHPLKDVMVKLRNMILESDRGITEHIKWNAPSFCVNDEDRFTFKINSPTSVDVVFHRGAKVKALPKKNLVEDPHGLLKWATTDRAFASFTSVADLKAKQEAFMGLINNWKIASFDPSL